MRAIYERVEVGKDDSLETLLKAAKGNLEATIEVDAGIGYCDSIETSVYVCWTRDETSEETQARKAKEAAEKQAKDAIRKRLKALKSEESYKEYLRLKEKYKDV